MKVRAQRDSAERLQLGSSRQQPDVGLICYEEGLYVVFLVTWGAAGAWNGVGVHHVTGTFTAKCFGTTHPNGHMEALQ